MSEIMMIYGVDFTSAPSKQKPIVVARCAFHEQTLILRQLLKLTDFEQFEGFLRTEGPWIAAMDFPLSMPHSWLQAMGWPTDWADSVRHIQQLSLKAFCQSINDYCRQQPAGQKHHFRPIDRLAGACSPMTIYYTPVGKMFYQGAFRLLDAGVSVLPFQDNLTQSKPAQGRQDASQVKADPHRIVVEGYPALIARQLCPKQGYKYESPPASASQKAAKDFVRKEMIQKLSAQWLTEDFGFSIDLNGHADTLWQDFTGDSLDAVFCAIQAAWAYSQREANFGIPQTVQAQEGWIAVPPHFLKQKQ